ncbi:MAG TPA: hypothetical protein DEB31_06975 [Clostridiales bacterium]|nr:hypothetical protein [Clostridiales bacterium]
MGVEHYLFALFVFVLAAMLVVLIMRGRNKNREKEEEERDEREKKMMMMYFEVEDMIDALKEYVEASREKVEADIRRVETDMSALSAMREGFQLIEERTLQPKAESAPEIHESEAPISFEEAAQNGPVLPEDGLHALALSLQREGKDIGQIAQHMSLSRTEVSFMLKLEQYHQQSQKNSIKSGFKS